MSDAEETPGQHDAANADDPLPAYSMSIAGTLLAAREAVMTPLRVRLRKARFTEAQWRVLRVLTEQGESDGRAIARAALLHPPSVTRIVQELALRGLIDRQIDERDGRKQRFFITVEGRSIVASSAKFNRLLMARYRAGFGSDRLGRLLRELRDFTDVVIHERNMITIADSEIAEE